MLNITIFSGGTGSIALQNGLNNIFHYGRYNLNVIINAYDNGKSTGICRKLCNNEILGPSDLRKNQLVSFLIKYKKELEDKNSSESKIYDLFNLRLSATNSDDYCKQAIDKIHLCTELGDKNIKLLSNCVISFFNNDKCKKETFNDFALSNIFYAQLAHSNDNSLSKAGKIIADILKIDNTVYLISDKSLLLKAKTETGYIIDDEGDIVNWKNENDKITNCFFINPSTNDEYIPYVGENNYGYDVTKIINDSDIIIFSSGTQWSSLIPTYIHSGFYELIKNSKAKKYLVMNNIQDKDMYGVTSKDMLNILKTYLPIDEITVVFNNNAVDEMKIVGCEKYIFEDLGENGSKVHNPNKLISTIFKDYYSIDKKYILVSDLDGTLIEKNNIISDENMKLFNGIIITGNMEKYVREKIVPNNNIDIYCDYGGNHILNDNSEIIIKDKEYYIDNDIVSILEDNADTLDIKDKIIIRNELIISIKPLYNREKYYIEIVKLIDIKKYKVCIAGKTTIDIMRIGYDKLLSLIHILNLKHIDFSDIIYFGNEFNKYGNDYCFLKNKNIKICDVRDIMEMNNILKLLEINNGI